MPLKGKMRHRLEAGSLLVYSVTVIHYNVSNVSVCTEVGFWDRFLLIVCVLILATQLFSKLFLLNFKNILA